MRTRCGLLYIGLVLAVAMVPALWLDMRLTRWIETFRTPAEVRKLLALSEVFAHGTGVLLILLTIFVLDPARRRSLVRLACCAFGSGLLADMVKVFVLRTRPEALGVEQFTGGVWSSFGGLAFFNWKSASQSFPSAHAATAVGLAIGLSHLYPRGRWLFALFAVLAALQRIQFLHHYASDVVAGALLGILVSAVLYRARPVAGAWERFESDIRST